MSEIRIDLTPPEVTACFCAVAEELILKEGRLTSKVRALLENQARSLGMHQSDVSPAITAVLNRSHIKAAIARTADADPSRDSPQVGADGGMVYNCAVCRAERLLPQPRTFLLAQGRITAEDACPVCASRLSRPLRTL